MPAYMERMIRNNIEEKKKAGSKKRWNLIAMKWITSVAPIEFSWMMNALKTLQCTPANSDARKAISNTLFINLSDFHDPGKALERLSTCLLFIQKRMDQSPRKWGQASSNVGLPLRDSLLASNGWVVIRRLWGTILKPIRCHVCRLAPMHRLPTTKSELSNRSIELSFAFSLPLPPTQASTFVHVCLQVLATDRPCGRRCVSRRFCT